MPARRDKLRVGDRIRIVRLPAEWDQPGYVVHRDTRALFRVLIARRRGLTIREFDEWGTPWIRCQTRGRNGRVVQHALGIFEADCWVRVVPRKNEPKE